MAKTDQSAVDAFLARAKAVAKKRNLKLSTLSLYIMNDGNVLPRLDENPGADIGTRKREAAEAELAKIARGKPTTYQLAAGLSGNPPPAGVDGRRRRASAG